MFRQRLFSALLVIPLVLAVTWAGGYLFLLAVLAVAFLAHKEFFRLADLSQAAIVRILPVASLIILLAAKIYGKDGLFTALFAFFLLVHIWWVVSFPADFRQLLLVVWGEFYLSGLLSFFILLRDLENGLMYVVALLFTVWAADSGAYFCGLAFGRHKLLPAVSPKKSVEGAVAGLVFGTVCLALLAPALRLTRPAGALSGLVLSLAGQAGDLVESAFKRWANTKDSGHFLPGHGGVLDRIDSLLFAAPLAYAIFSFYF
ncbi:MAG: phosphatidate cytidylyltransferase [Firmicutes bacterium]|nr:phosphatidate cytidylyltransferase [Bacillota bacterium]